MEAIPIIDLLEASTDKPGISKAIKSRGFLALKSPNEPTSSQISELFRISQEFFENESADEKERCAATEENVGWVEKRQEKLDPSGYPRGDNKELSHIGVFNIAGFTPDGPAQPLPSLLGKHTHELSEFIKSCRHLLDRLLEAFALDMGLPREYFTSRHTSDSAKDSSILRLLYYPPTNVDDAQAGGDIRAGAHSDYGTLTLLFQKDVGGLQILVPSGIPGAEPQWLDVPVIPESVLVNIGDAFDFWTGGRFPSTQHRVSAPRNSAESAARFSIAYFLHPSDDEVLERIPQSGHDKEDALSVIQRFGVDPSSRVTSKEWLVQRLDSTYGPRKKAT